jgi:pyrroloquinoline quinone (PQQ) biosynthesis protein C
MSALVLTTEQKQLIKQRCWERINDDPLIQGCKIGNLNYLRALFIGYWDFVDRFPSVIMDSYADSGRFARYGKVLSGALCEMEDDERVHRQLWLRSAAAANVAVEELYAATALAETQALIDGMWERNELWQRLLDFVAVEIIAEGISVCLTGSEAFRAVMGQEGMPWFKVHMIHDAGETTHEDIAYRAAAAMLLKSGKEPTFELIDTTLQQTIDRFFAAGAASRKAYC